MAAALQNRIFVYGYHGLRNIGAESRLIAIVHALRWIAPSAEIVVNSFHRKNLDYLSEARVDYSHPATYRWAAPRRIDAADALVLSEGNVLTEAFTKHMLVACLSALEYARDAGVPSVGLALDSGTVSEARRERVVRALESTDLLTVRAPGAREELSAMGVAKEMPVTADCAPSMPLPDAATIERVQRRFGLNDGPVFGIAPVDFFMYPARIALMARPSDYVRWPFRATWPDGGRQRSAELVGTWTGVAERLLLSVPGSRIALIVMDPSDSGIARAIAERLGRPERTLLLEGADLNPFEMSAAFAKLKSIVTSRYHALVMPLPYAVPYIAVGHDTRMRFISEQLGVERFWIPHDAPNLASTITHAHEQLMLERGDVQESLYRGFLDFRERDAENYLRLGNLLTDLGYAVRDYAPAL